MTTVGGLEVGDVYWPCLRRQKAMAPAYTSVGVGSPRDLLVLGFGTIRCPSVQKKYDRNYV